MPETERPDVDWDRTLTAEEIRDLGVLHEVNRQLLHPRGLALTLNMSEGNLTVLDWRSDPEGVSFAPEALSADKARVFQDLLEQKQEHRKKALGFVVQPVTPPRKQSPSVDTTKYPHYLGTSDRDIPDDYKFAWGYSSRGFAAGKSAFTVGIFRVLHPRFRKPHRGNIIHRIPGSEDAFQKAEEWIRQWEERHEQGSEKS